MPQLSGRRILVVEDDFLLAADLCEALRSEGAIALGPAPTANYALSLIGARGVDAAILDIRLHNADVYALADALHSNKVPWIFATGALASSIPHRFGKIPVLAKPYAVEEIIEIVLGLLGTPKTGVAPQPAPVPDRYRMEQIIIRALGMG